MSPAEASAATVTVICVAVIAAYRILCWLLDRHIRARREENLELNRWQQTAADAAQAVEDDVAELRREREITELEAWLRLPLQSRNTIPYQTRRTEEDR